MLAYIWTPLQHWLAIHTGTDNESAGYYGFWSGFGSDIGEVTLLVAVVSYARSINCHEPHCWRMGKHTTVDGHKLCRTHIVMGKDDLNLAEPHSDHTP